MVELLPIFKKAYWSLAALSGTYVAIIVALTNPWLQRQALYVNNLHSGFYHDVDKPEQFGFARGQVTPFNVSTPDGETLYAWHVLPLNVYAANQDTLIARRATGVEHPESLALELLRKDPNAKVVVNFHGNAGHIAQGWRTDTYRSLTSQPNTHLVTIDYRGFGKSTGSPTEAGLVTDGVALVNWVLDIAGIEAKRVVILGQSLGTAVATAVGLQFADPQSDLLPALPSSSSSSTPQIRADGKTSSTTLAGIILVAPFTSLPSLLLTYRIAGVLPVLAPLRPAPFLLSLFTARIVDKWPTAARLAAYVKALTDTSRPNGSTGAQADSGTGSVQILHAINDADIPCEQSRLLFLQAVGGGGESVEKQGADSAVKRVWKQPGAPVVSLEILDHGGHNRVVTYAPVALAVMRAFARAGAGGAGAAVGHVDA